MLFFLNIIRKECGSKYYDLFAVEPDRLPNIASYVLGFSNNRIPFHCILRSKLFDRIYSHLIRPSIHAS